MENIIVKSSGVLIWKGKEYRAALGKGGVTQVKKEGDGATPVGCFAIRKIYYRADRVGKPKTNIETVTLEKNDGWSDDVNDSTYNTHVKLPYSGSHEKLWREDNVYDIIVELGYNDDPPIPGKGSAIFMHVARESYSPTAGCVALKLEDLTEVLESILPETKVCIE